MTKISVYKTYDGRLFERLDEAIHYEECQCREYILRTQPNKRQVLDESKLHEGKTK